MDIVTLTTDFGLEDWYVAAVRGVLLSRNPAVRLVDVSHLVPPGDVEHASFLLAAAVPTFPARTVHLAVVDPGVGTARRILLVEGDATLGGQCFVAPDNGLLTPFFDRAERIVAVDRDDLYREAPGHTFHGRDRFAPVAAEVARRLGAGLGLDGFGPEIDDPVRSGAPEPRRSGEALVGRVQHIDRFGNLVTDLPVAWLHPEFAPDAEGLVVEVEGHSADLWVDTYRNIPRGRAAALTGSLGTIELSFDGASLAGAWSVARGAQVVVRRRRTAGVAASMLSGEENDSLGIQDHQHPE